MMRVAALACAGCTVAALRSAIPTKDPGDPTLCQNMLDPSTLPAGMTLLQTGAYDVSPEVPSEEVYKQLDTSGRHVEEVESGAEHFSELALHNDAADFSHLSNRNIIFMGDSAIEELMWDLIFTLNETSPDDGGWNNVPARQCTYQKCQDVCGGRDTVVPHQHLHMLGRCSLTSSPECMETMPQIQKLNTTFSFLWTATPFICCNGIPGLYATIRNPVWLDVFHEYAARAPYDDLVFAAGTHDFFALKNETESEIQYRSALETFLGMLEPLAKRLVFISPYNPRRPRIVNIEMLARHPKWQFVDRVDYNQDLHCSTAKWTFDYFHYKRSTHCHNMIRDIFIAK